MEDTPMEDHKSCSIEVLDSTSLTPEISEAGTTVFGIQELLEEVLKHLPPGALLRHQRVCKNWHFTINKFAHFKRSLFLLPAEATELWDIDRRAAHRRSHAVREQVVLGKTKDNLLPSAPKLPIACKICSGRGIPRPEEHTQRALLPIQFNPLFCEQRPEDKADSLDERASRLACADIYLRDWGLGDDKPRPWHNMFLTQPACQRVRVQVFGELEGDLGSIMTLTDDFVSAEPGGVRLGKIVAAMKKRVSYLEPGEVYIDYVTIFVPNAVEVMQGDEEEEVEKRTKARDEEQ